MNKNSPVPFRCQIITKEKIAFDDVVISIMAPGVEGYFGVLAHHAPLMALLKWGILTIKTDLVKREFLIRQGVLEVLNNEVVIIVDPERRKKTRDLKIKTTVPLRKHV